MIGIKFCKSLIALSVIFGIFCNAEDESRIFFDGPVSRGNHQTSDLEMEIQMAQEYSQIENIEDFITRINGIPEGVNLAESPLTIGTRIGSARSNAEIPKAATCVPQLEPVSLRNSTIASSAHYIPSCTRVPRCGGCCGHVSLSCQPTATIIRNFQVIITEYDIGTGLTYKSKEIVPIEEHTKCKCDCRIQAHHCNDRQNYLPKECRCACTNVDEESKCLASNNTKIWDENTCVCKCRGSIECTTGSYYDHNTCSCKKIGVGAGNQRRHGVVNQGSNQRRMYSFDTNNSDRVPPSIFSVSANDPRRRHREDPEN